jgi:ABC-type transport system involved in multi-copper enzyme maturation permease subunit
LFIGPVFTREAIVAPRRVRHFLTRGVYATALLLLIFTAWLVLTGTQRIVNVGDMARFGAVLFQVLAPLQLALMLFLAAIGSASNVSVEKDRETLVLLLMSRLTNSELVLGKLFASLLSLGVMLLTSLPIFMLIVLFGGTSFAQVGWTFAVTAAAVLTAGSLGCTIAFWREKTFQALALVALLIVFWIGLFEGIALVPTKIGGYTGQQLAATASPFRAILAASHPTVTETWPTEVLPFLIVAAAMSVLLCGIAIVRVRQWNPNRDVRQNQSVGEESGGIDVFTGSVIGVQDEIIAAHNTAQSLPHPASQPENATTLGQRAVADGERFRSGHVDDRTRSANTSSRRVWDNPILWREVCTWAYGKKIVFIRAAYWLLTAIVFMAVYTLITNGVSARTNTGSSILIPAYAKPLAPFLFVSIVMVNALAVTAITTERDGRALDLLMVTDLSPKEFLFGKLFGVLVIAADMILLPLLIVGYLWFCSLISLENLFYLSVGFLTVNVFGIVLGIHCGMSYNFSRQAISVSLGTVFFLFLGVVTSMVMMVSFTGSVEAQFGPFLACLVGGAIGLYVALGWNSPSSALALASAALPLAMFYSITSLLMGNYLSAFIVMTGVYSYATVAIMLPRLTEFLVSTRRLKTAEDG